MISCLNTNVGPWVAYYRVSTTRQGESGLGLDAQRESVARYLTAHGGVFMASYTETESGRRASNRPQLAAALNLCRNHRAILVIAKLDRLARNVHFISGLLESGVDFVAVDQPTKDRFMLHVQAAFAEEEARRISIRTKEALAAAKRRGVDIGATGRVRAVRYKREAVELAQKLAPVVLSVRSEGFNTLRALRDELNRREIPSPGGARWHLPNLSRTLKRLKLPAASSM